MNYMSIPSFKNQLIKNNFEKIYAHEKAHKNAAGALAGAIVIEKNAQGIPVGGHVSIKMPTLNPKNPKRTIEHADTVINSAIAPADPSSQDYKVAAQAKNIKAQAKNIKAQAINLQDKQKKRLDYYA